MAQANAQDLTGDADDEYEYEYEHRPRRRAPTAAMAQQLANAVVAAAVTHMTQGPRQVVTTGSAPGAVPAGPVVPMMLAQTTAGVPMWVPAPNGQGANGAANGGAQGNGQ